jgi:two-component system cell cycle response regulator DivK
VTKWIKDDPDLTDIPVVAVTAFAMKGDEKKILEGGCEGYISKPITREYFMRAVEYYSQGNKGPFKIEE